MKMVKIRTLIGLMVFGLVFSVGFGVFMNSDALAQGQGQGPQGPPVSVIGILCFPEDSPEPENRADAEDFCNFACDVFGLDCTPLVVTRCPSPNSAQNNRPFGVPGSFCPDVCIEGAIAYQCTGFFDPSNN